MMTNDDAKLGFRALPGRGSPAAVKAALKILKITQLEDSELCTKMTSFCRTQKDLKGRKQLRISP